MTTIKYIGCTGRTGDRFCKDCLKAVDFKACQDYRVHRELIPVKKARSY